MDPAVWLSVLAAEIEMAPGFLAALDRQLRSQARRLCGVDDIANGDYSLLPPDEGFTVQFRSTGAGVAGVIEGVLVDPSAAGHPVAFGWLASGAIDRPVRPDQERDDLQFFWLEFPVAELSAGTRVDVSVAAAAVTAPFPVEWDVHRWDSVSLDLRASRAFGADELEVLTAAMQDAVRDWNARAPNPVHYLADAETAPDLTSVRWYLDLGAAGPDAVVAAVNALGASSAAASVARCFVGRCR